MGLDLSAIKKRTKSAESLAATAKAKESSGQDDRFWKLNVDASGNGFARFRFLPHPGKHDLPWVRYFSHAFKGPNGQWLAGNCLTSLGEDCPVCEMNQRLWNVEDPIQQEKYRALVQGNNKDKPGSKRRLNYVANIYIISDQAKPDNEGKVFLFRFGKKIYDKLMDAMQPEFDDKEPINPFDLWEGAEFVLKAKNNKGFRSYDDSYFKDPSALFDGDEDQLQRDVADKVISLDEFVDPENYPEYKQTQARLVAMRMPLAIVSEHAEETSAGLPAEELDSEPPRAAKAEEPSLEDIKDDPVDDDDDGVFDDDDDDDVSSYFEQYMDNE